MTTATSPPTASTASSPVVSAQAPSPSPDDTTVRELEREFFSADQITAGVADLSLRAIQIALWSLFYAGLYLGRMLRVLVTVPAPERQAARDHIKGRCLRELFQRLSATFIKVGQILSSRPDLFSSEIIDEISQLQDKVPPFAPRLLDGIFERDFGRPPEAVFAEFTRAPIASASVAQVHAATLPTGERAAVKILRPDIRRNAVRDLRLMQFGARLLERLPSMHWMSPTHMVDEFAKSLAGQLDLRREAANSRRFRENFAHVPEVDFPLVYPEYSTEHVLTMEFIDGVKVADIDTLDVDTAEVARACIMTAGRMVFDDGFVHCDLHPGNVFFTGDGRIVLLDVGMVTELNDLWKVNSAKAMYYRMTNNGPMMAKQLYDMADYKAETDYPAFEADIDELVQGMYLRSLENIEFSVVFGAILTVLRRHRVKLNMSWTMAMMAAITGEGIAKRLDPNVQLETVLLPMLQGRFGPPADEQT